jgi:Cellulase (glycosyl hydrolase family 5)
LAALAENRIMPGGRRPSALAMLVSAATLAGAALALPTPSQAATYVAPDPGGNERARVSLPPPTGKHLGFNEGVWGVAREVEPADFVEIVDTAGGNLIRTPLDWRHAEPVEDVWSGYWWPRWRELYDAALERGVTPLFTIAMAPPWAWEQGQAGCAPIFGRCELPPADTPRMNAEWAEFAAEVARRFPKAILEVWNEPNYTLFWDSGPAPERWAELQVLAYDAIKEVDRSITVISGGLTFPPQTDSTGMTVPEYLSRAYAADPSIAGHMDAIGIHPYPYDNAFGADTLFAQSMHQVRSVRRAQGDSSTPLFITEFGVSTGAPEHHTERQRAAAVLRLYRRAITMPDVEGVVFHRLVEPEDSNEWEVGSAWLRNGSPPLEPKRAYCTFVEQAGNSYAPCPARSAVDIDAPQTKIAKGPDRAVRSPRPVFRFRASEPRAHFICALDGGEPSRCTKRWRPPPLSAGPHVLAVSAQDAAGNVDPSPARKRFRIRRRG